MKIRIMLIKLFTIFALWQIVLAESPSEEKEDPCELSPEVGTYMSSQNFPNNFNIDRENRIVPLECSYKLKVQPGKKVLLTFFYVDLSPYKCDTAYLEIKNGDKDPSYLCGKSFNSEQILSETNELEFKFIYSSWASYGGWVAKYEAVDQTYDLSKSKGTSYLLDYPANLLRNRTEQVCVEDLKNLKLEDLYLTVEVFKTARKNDIFPFPPGPPGQPRPIPFRSQTVESFGDSVSAGNADRDDTVADKEPLIEGKLDIEGCLDIMTNHAPGQAMLRIVLKKNNEIIEELYRFVKIEDRSDKILIQTDKGKYKSGSTVKIRWLTLDDDLKSSGLKLSEVNVADPKSRIIQQWKSPQNPDGINQQEFELFEEAPVGRYTITVKVDDTREHEAFFEVAEYTLPRFEVKIKDPSAVIPGSASSWKVCAQYTHGAPVPGLIKASFSTNMMPHPHHWRHPPPPFFRDEMEALNKTVLTTEESSCTQIVLRPEELRNLTREFDRRRIALNIEFIEDGTKEVMKAKTVNNLVLQEFKIGFGSSSNSYSVGGFDYSGQIKVENYDGTGRSEKLRVCTRLFKDIEKVRDQFSNQWRFSEGGRRKFCRNKEQHKGFKRLSNSLRYKIRIKCRRQNFDEDEFIEAAEAIEDMQYDNNCKDYTADNMGLINFHVHLNGLDKEIKKLSIKVTAPDYERKVDALTIPKGILDVDLLHTSADISMSIQSKDRSELACGKENQVTVNFAGPKDTNHKMTYYLLAGSQNIKSGDMDVNLSGNSDNLYENSVEFSPGNKTKLDPKADTNMRIQQVNIRFPIDYRSYPDVKLVVMVAAGNGTLTDSHEFKVGYCTKHKVALKLNKEQTQPRGEVRMDITADTGSKCGVSLVDKSVDILGNDNKVTQKKIGDILRSIKSSKISAFDNNYEIRNKCPEVHKLIQVFLDAGRQIYSDIQLFKECDTYIREKGITYPTYDEYEYENYDAGYSFTSSMQSSDTRSQQRPQPRPMYAPANGNVAMRRKEQQSDVRREGQEPEFNPKDAPEVRTQFPETWLFDLQTFDGSSRFYNAPDTLTSWTAEAVCLSPDKGLGVATPQKLIVTQDFFSDLRLPASVKRGESFPMNISVFNNLNSQLPLVLTIQGDNIQPDEKRQELCLNGQSSDVVSIPTRALSAGEVNISVALEIRSVSGCEKAAANSGFVDRLERPLLVKPEGIPVEEVKSKMVCLKSGQQDVEFERLTLPDQVVPDSARAYAFISGDVMAASLKNIGNLVRLPTGCGEQNMIRLAPNVYLLDYMKSNSKKDEELEEKALGYMRIGIERQARYKHTDGSYSIWGGDNNKDSSTWLTAFVVKVFSQASRYIEVDDSNLKKSVNWLLETQGEDGCFEKRGYVHDSGLQGGDSNSSLNAFVLNSLYEYSEFAKKQPRSSSRFQTNLKNSINNAAKCLVDDGKKNNFFSDDLYSLSLANYALNLASTDGYNPQLKRDAKGFKDALDEKKNTSIPGALFWDAKTSRNSNRYWYYPRSLAVEVTAYNIMSLILEERTDEAVNAVKWLAKNKNSQGGFSSTQDTVVGLQALSQYGNIIGGYSTDLIVQVSSGGGEISSLKLNEDNKQVLKRERLPSLPADIGFNLQGPGCVILQTSLRYNVPESKKTPAFNIQHKYKKNDVLEICTRYIGSKASTDMAIMEVEMLSGYSARNPEALVNEIDQFVKKVEVKEKENIVVLYFDQLDMTERCIELEMITEFKVKDLKPARIHVYDYYNTEDSHEILYNKM